MKACLMKMNYDPKYTTPHVAIAKDKATGQKHSALSLQSRLDVCQDIYGIKRGRDGADRKTREVTTDDFAGKQKRHLITGNGEVQISKEVRKRDDTKTRPRDGIARKDQGEDIADLSRSRNLVRLHPLQPTPSQGAPLNANKTLRQQSPKLTTGHSREAFYQRSKTMPALDNKYVLKPKRVVDVERRAKCEAERAARDKKIFLISGPYPTLRKALRKRGWVEKFKNDPTPLSLERKTEDKENNEEGLLERQKTVSRKEKPWEEDNGLYGYMSRVVRNVTPTFVFTVKSMDVDSRVIKSGQVVNHFGKAQNITTKAGLSQSLQYLPWYDHADPATFYPRCYRLDDPEEREDFIDNFRLTACISFLRYFVEKYAPQPVPSSAPPEPKAAEKRGASTGREKGDENEKANDGGNGLTEENTEDGSETTTKQDNSYPKLTGTIRISILEHSIAECERFIRSKTNDDIDSPIDETLSESEWDLYLLNYYHFVNNMKDFSSPVDDTKVSSCRELLNRLKLYWSQYSLDGYRNVWIIKPGAKSRGRGIQISDSLPLILQPQESGDTCMVVQKYIENPLLVYKTKFDIRQWFLVTDWNPLTIWFYRDCYLRFCSQEFTLDDFHISIHLSNNSVQKHFENGEQRSPMLPNDNMWTSDLFQDYLRERGRRHEWHDVVVPGMKHAIISALLCCQENIDSCKSAFELFGADFMLTDDLQPWLIEINSSPSMAQTTDATAVLVENVLEDMIKVVIDRKLNRDCDTGRFEQIYRQATRIDQPTVDLTLSVEGHKIKKGSHRK